MAAAPRAARRRRTPACLTLPLTVTPAAAASPRWAACTLLVAATPLGAPCPLASVTPLSLPPPLLSLVSRSPALLPLLLALPLAAARLVCQADGAPPRQRGRSLCSLPLPPLRTWHAAGRPTGRGRLVGCPPWRGALRSVGCRHHPVACQRCILFFTPSARSRRRLRGRVGWREAGVARRRLGGPHTPTHSRTLGGGGVAAGQLGGLPPTALAADGRCGCGSGVTPAQVGVMRSVRGRVFGRGGNRLVAGG